MGENRANLLARENMCTPTLLLIRAACTVRKKAGRGQGSRLVFIASEGFGWYMTEARGWKASGCRRRIFMVPARSPGCLFVYPL
jgi:hypothetical protein